MSVTNTCGHSVHEASSQCTEVPNLDQCVTDGVSSVIKEEHVEFADSFTDPMLLGEVRPVVDQSVVCCHCEPEVRIKEEPVCVAGTDEPEMTVNKEDQTEMKEEEGIDVKSPENNSEVDERSDSAVIFDEAVIKQEESLTLDSGYTKEQCILFSNITNASGPQGFIDPTSENAIVVEPGESEFSDERKKFSLSNIDNIPTEGVKRKRSSYNAAFKLEVVKYAEEKGNRAAERQYFVSESAIRYWRKSKEILEEMPKTKKARRGKAAAYPETEKELLGWITEQRYGGFAVSLLQIRQKAIQIHPDASFKASSNWIYGFVKRQGLVLLQESDKGQ